jgi:hypothetical protein
MSLWYPTRTPFCTQELIKLLTLFIDTTHEFILTQNTYLLSILTRITHDVHKIIEQENNTCYGTDRVLNTVRILFEDALVGIRTAYQNKLWKAILEIITNMTIIRDTLKEECEKIIRGTL